MGANLPLHERMKRYLRTVSWNIRGQASVRRLQVTTMASGVD